MHLTQSQAQSTKELQGLLRCGICKEIMSDPCQLLNCGHNFCRECLLELMGKLKETSCPTCKTPGWLKDMARNATLAGVLASFLELHRKLNELGYHMPPSSEGQGPAGSTSSGLEGRAAAAAAEEQEKGGRGGRRGGGVKGWGHQEDRMEVDQSDEDEEEEADRDHDDRDGNGGEEVEGAFNSPQAANTTTTASQQSPQGRDPGLVVHNRSRQSQAMEDDDLDQIAPHEEVTTTDVNGAGSAPNFTHESQDLWDEVIDCAGDCEPLLERASQHTSEKDPIASGVDVEHSQPADQKRGVQSTPLYDSDDIDWGELAQPRTSGEREASQVTGQQQQQEEEDPGDCEPLSERASQRTSENDSVASGVEVELSQPADQKQEVRSTPLYDSDDIDWGELAQPRTSGEREASQVTGQQQQQQQQEEEDPGDCEPLSERASQRTSENDSVASGVEVELSQPADQKQEVRSTPLYGSDDIDWGELAQPRTSVDDLPKHHKSAIREEALAEEGNQEHSETGPRPNGDPSTEIPTHEGPMPNQDDFEDGGGDWDDSQELEWPSPAAPLAHCEKAAHDPQPATSRNGPSSSLEAPSPAIAHTSLESQTTTCSVPNIADDPSDEDPTALAGEGPLEIDMHKEGEGRKEEEEEAEGLEVSGAHGNTSRQSQSPAYSNVKQAPDLVGAASSPSMESSSQSDVSERHEEVPAPLVSPKVMGAITVSSSPALPMYGQSPLPSAPEFTTPSQPTPGCHGTPTSSTPSSSTTTLSSEKKGDLGGVPRKASSSGGRQLKLTQCVGRGAASGDSTQGGMVQGNTAKATEGQERSWLPKRGIQGKSKGGKPAPTAPSVVPGQQRLNSYFSQEQPKGTTKKQNEAREDDLDLDLSDFHGPAIGEKASARQPASTRSPFSPPLDLERGNEEDEEEGLCHYGGGLSRNDTSDEDPQKFSGAPGGGYLPDYCAAPRKDEDATAFDIRGINQGAQTSIPVHLRGHGGQQQQEQGGSQGLRSRTVDDQSPTSDGRSLHAAPSNFDNAEATRTSISDAPTGGPCQHEERLSSNEPGRGLIEEVTTAAEGVPSSYVSEALVGSYEPSQTSDSFRAAQSLPQQGPVEEPLELERPPPVNDVEQEIESMSTVDSSLQGTTQDESALHGDENDIFQLEATQYGDEDCMVSTTGQRRGIIPDSQVPQSLAMEFDHGVGEHREGRGIVPDTQAWATSGEFVARGVNVLGTQPLDVIDVERRSVLPVLGHRNPAPASLSPPLVPSMDILAGDTPEYEPEEADRGAGMPSRERPEEAEPSHAPASPVESVEVPPPLRPMASSSPHQSHGNGNMQMASRPERDETSRHNSMLPRPVETKASGSPSSQTASADTLGQSESMPAMAAGPSGQVDPSEREEEGDGMAPIVDLTETGSNSQSQLHEPGTQTINNCINELDNYQHQYNVLPTQEREHVAEAFKNEHKEITESHPWYNESLGLEESSEGCAASKVHGPEGEVEGICCSDLRAEHRQLAEQAIKGLAPQRYTISETLDSNTTIFLVDALWTGNNFTLERSNHTAAYQEAVSRDITVVDYHWITESKKAGHWLEPDEFSARKSEDLSSIPTSNEGTN